MTQNHFIERLRSYPPIPDKEICYCVPPTPIKIMYALSNNPLHCINCNLELPLDAITVTEEDVEAIERWRNIYAAIYTLWLDSDSYELWAREELLNIKSHVNTLGLELTAKLIKTRKTYYWYFQDHSEEDFSPQKNCPKCNSPFMIYSEGIFTQHICDNCNIITTGE